MEQRKLQQKLNSSIGYNNCMIASSTQPGSTDHEERTLHTWFLSEADWKGLKVWVQVVRGEGLTVTTDFRL